MVARVLAVAAVCLVVAPAAGAARGRLVVSPLNPVVGVRAQIEVHAKARAPLVARVVSPTGVHLKVRLTKVRGDLWRAAFHFTDDGQWTVRVAGTRVARVLVLQPGAALPPFRPNTPGGSKAGSLSGLVTPGIVIGR
jgi:hypothetical protein